MRPDMRMYAHFEHIIAFAVIGALFSFAYPRRILLVCCIVVGGAAVLEVLQTLTPDRHGTLVDAFEKMAGGGAGIMFAEDRSPRKRAASRFRRTSPEMGKSGVLRSSMRRKSLAEPGYLVCE